MRVRALQARACAPALTSRCSGTLQERAQRLFSVKGLDPEEYPVDLLAVAAPKKRKKRRGAGGDSKEAAAAAAEPKVLARTACTRCTALDHAACHAQPDARAPGRSPAGAGVQGATPRGGSAGGQGQGVH